MPIDFTRIWWYNVFVRQRSNLLRKEVRKWTRWQPQSSISILRTSQSWLKRMQRMLKQPPRSFGTAKWRHKKVAAPFHRCRYFHPNKVSREPYPGHLQYTSVRQRNQGKQTNREEHKLNIESREQTMAKIEFHLPSLTDAQLRMVAGFIRGIQKGEGRAWVQQRKR